MQSIKQDTNIQFKEQFDLLSKHTPEYEITVPYIVESIVSKLPERRHFIDVGTGRGNLARPISTHFDVTTIIEPNKYYHDEIMDWARQSDRAFRGHNTDWLNVEMSENAADMVLMSHVMYYVDNHDWSRFVQKAYDLLNPGGYVVIILNSLQNGVTDLYKAFLRPDEWLDIASSEALVQTLLDDQYTEISVRSYQSDIIAESAAEAQELIDFLLLHRVNFEDMLNREIRENYAEAHLRNGKYYVIRADGHIISICKPLSTGDKQ